MLLCILILFWAVFKFGFVNVGTAYLLLLPCFLSAAIFRIYAITPLMSPKFAFLVVLALFMSSQVFTVATMLGYFKAGFVLGHFMELGVFSWAYSRSQQLYKLQPI